MTGTRGSQPEIRSKSHTKCSGVNLKTTHQTKGQDLKLNYFKEMISDDSKMMEIFDLTWQDLLSNQNVSMGNDNMIETKF